MSATERECVCHEAGPNNTDIFHKKDYVRYHLGEFPFTTARKINHTCCAVCGGLTNADANKELTDDMCKNRLFIAEQDKMYKDGPDGNGMMYAMVHGEGDDINNIVRPSAKQWHRGYINYLRFKNVDDKFVIVPTSTPYEVYCNDTDRLSVVAKQFIKPDDYFKLTSIQ